jgi:NADH-quinone oxidoreductase subunit I
MSGTPVNKAASNERKLNFWERMYLPAVFQGLGYTFRKMTKEPVYTFRYPDEQWYPPDSYRGRPVLVEEEGRPRCVSCNLCARVCPPMAISMQGHEVENVKEREPKWFEINMLRCIYCGFCEDVCPEEAIVMSKEYDLTFQSREEAVFGLDRLLVPKERLEDRFRYLKQYRNGQFGSDWQFERSNNIHSLRDQAFLRYLMSEDLSDLEHTTSIEDREDQPLADPDWGAPRQGAQGGLSETR